MLLLVAYYNLGYGSHGRDRLREHVPNANDKPLCGAPMNDEDKLLWKIIDSKPKYLCKRCAELSTPKSDADKLREWTEGKPIK